MPIFTLLLIPFSQLYFTQKKGKLIKDLFQIAENHFYSAQYEDCLVVLEKISQEARQINDWESFVRAKNELGIVLTHLSQYNSALVHLLEAEEMGRDYLSSNHIQIATTLDALGVFYASEKKYEKSNPYFVRALEILKTTKKHPQVLASVYNNMAWCLCEMGKYHEALGYHEEALSIRLNHEKEFPDQVAQTYNNMAMCHVEMGDTNKALTYYQKAFNIWLDVFGEKHAQIATALNNIGLCYSRQADFHRAIPYYQKALQLRQEIFGFKHLRVAQSFENIGYSLMRTKQYEEALEFYNKGFEIRKLLVGENHPTLVKIYRNIGVCYMEMQNFELAFEFLDKALNIYLQIPFPQPLEKTVIYTALGDYYRETRQYLKSIEAFHQVIASAVPHYMIENLYETPELNQYFHQVKLGYALKHKGKAFLELYLQSQNKKDLDAGFAHLKKSVQVLNENRQSYSTAASKLNHAKLVVNTYEWSIWAAYLEYQQTQSADSLATAFAFAELSKSYVLFSKLKETEAKISAHIPQHLLQKEKNLQIELSSLDKRMQQLQSKKNKEHSEKMQLDLQSKYFDVSLAYEQVIQEIEQKYPQYYQLKYDLQTAHPADLQKVIPDGKLLVNYFVGIENIFIFGISKSQLYFHHLPKPDDLNDTIEYIHDAIGMGDEEDLLDLGAQLYEVLLEPIVSQVPHCNQLIIIPDDCLHRLPFDVLTVGKGRWTANGERWTENGGWQKEQEETTSRYLIELVQISYHYSTTLWLESFKKVANSDLADSFLGVAPVSFEGMVPQDLNAPVSSNYGELVLKSDFDADGTLKELKDSKDEIQGIYDLFQTQKLEGKMLLYEQATKDKFLQQLEGKKYIVLSSHGFYNEENPSLSGIYFAKEVSEARSQESENIIESSPSSVHRSPSTVENNESMKLYISDTFHLRLDADLVVLSSCESGIGELQKGEGMLALNRGFLYAGVQNIIYSLFKVPDAASQFTPNFFRYVLAEKCSYTEALQKAKLDLIAAGSEPLYWAGFALVGK